MGGMGMAKCKAIRWAWAVAILLLVAHAAPAAAAFLSENSPLGATIPAAGLRLGEADANANATPGCAGVCLRSAAEFFVAPSAARQTLGRAPSSRLLGENLEATGVSRPANSAAHHIVAGDDIRAAQARAILQREGIDINEAANGAFLPRNQSVAAPPASTHSTLHTNRYYQQLTTELQQAAPGTVRDVLADIAQRLQNGTFPH